MSDADALLPLKEVKRRSSLSRSSIYRKMDAGEFPKLVHVTDRRVAWYESEVNNWVNQFKKDRPVYGVHSGVTSEHTRQ